MLTRRHLSRLYTPVGPKPVSIGNAWASGGGLTLNGQVDLSTPIFGFRLEFKGRLVTGTSNFASVNPEGFLNLISRVLITGTNKRQGGSVTLWDLDLASIFVMQHLSAYRAAHGDIGAAALAVPTMPFPATYANVATGTYDFRFVIDLPSFPFNCPEGVRPGFLIRNEEWKDSISVQLFYGSQVGGAVAGAFGTGAAGTTVAFSGFGGVGANPTVDVMSLPGIMGLSEIKPGLKLKDSVLPGFCTRVQQPLAATLAASGAGITLLNLQKQPTTRIFVKTGTAVVSPACATLSDAIITAAGVTLGGNRAVRNKLDIFAHKQQSINLYGRDPIQGYFMFDFMDSQNPDSAYPGDKITDGSSFALVGDVTTVANAFGIAVQEQELYRPEGALYSF